MIRGEEELLSIMNEMARGDKEHHTENGEEEVSGTRCPAEVEMFDKKIRLLPEIEGYGDSGRSCPENGKGGNIWNPYVSVRFKDVVSSSSDIQGDGHIPPTCPHVEVARRRAYENFKKKFYTAFKWIVDNSQSQKVDKKDSEKKKVTMESLWKELPSHSILERFYFAFKVEETFRVMQNERNKQSLGKLPIRADIIQITRFMTQGFDEGILIDPILLTPFHKHQVSGGLLKREVMFQFTREWKRATKGKECDDLPAYFSSRPFQKKCSKIVKMINDLCVEAESNLIQDLKKKASEVILNSGNKTRNKKSTPKLSHESHKATDSDDIIEYYTLTFSGLSFRVGKAHFEKLQRLFDRHNTSSASIEEHQHLFLCDLFVLLARYDLLEGAGLQSSLSGNVFDVLLKHFNCNFECFASPFNCRYERFCSAFPDTDCPFGSFGSFFNFNFEALPHGGCFQANPPFTSDFLLKMCDRLEKLLTNGSITAPFMFVIFVPAWQDSQGWKALSTSSSTVHHLFLSQKDDPHYYCEGTQYRRMKSRYRIASFDTSIFFMQNIPAKEQWPISDSIIQELKIAFQTNPENRISTDSKSKGSTAKYKIEAEAVTTASVRQGAIKKNDISVGNSQSGHKRKQKRQNIDPVKRTKKTKKKFADDDQSQMMILSSLAIPGASVSTAVHQTNAKKSEKVKK